MNAPIFDVALSDVHFVTDHLDRAVTDDEPMTDYADRTMRRMWEPPCPPPILS